MIMIIIIIIYDIFFLILILILNYIKRNMVFLFKFKIVLEIFYGKFNYFLCSGFFKNYKYSW